jgi:hypothetical protein
MDRHRRTHREEDDFIRFILFFEMRKMGYQGGLISTLTKIQEDTQTDGYTDKQQGDLISLLLFFQNK